MKKIENEKYKLYLTNKILKDIILHLKGELIN